MRRLFRVAVECALELALLPVLVAFALASRVASRPVDVGIGPEPFVTHRYLQRAFELAGYRAETFVTHVYFISNDFDINLDRALRYWFLEPFARIILNAIRMFIIAVTRYRCLYIRFNGGPLMETRLLRHVEPQLLSLAGLKIIVCGYGSDVQDPLHIRSLAYKHAIISDYPRHHLAQRKISRQIKVWTRRADFVIGGCDWVDYMPHWDRLVLADWCIDTAPDTTSGAETKTNRHSSPSATRPLRILHAPNHTNIKGTAFLRRAVEALQRDGLAVELVIRQRASNSEILALIDDADIIADQFVIGWYGFFAVEAMARRRPVLSFLDPRYIELFHFAGIIGNANDIPIISTHYAEIETRLRWAAHHRDELLALGERGVEFVRRYHSIESRAVDVAAAMAAVGLSPRDV